MKLSLSQKIIVPSVAVFVLLQLGLAACALDQASYVWLGQRNAGTTWAVADHRASTAGAERALAEARCTIVVAILASAAVATLFVTLIVRRVLHDSITHLLNELKVGSAGLVRQPAGAKTRDDFEQLAGAVHALVAQLRVAADPARTSSPPAVSKPESLEHAVPR